MILEDFEKKVLSLRSDREGHHTDAAANAGGPTHLVADRSPKDASEEPSARIRRGRGIAWPRGGRPETLSARTQRVPGIALPRGTHRRPRAHGSGAFPESLCPEGRTGGPSARTQRVRRIAWPRGSGSEAPTARTLRVTGIAWPRGDAPTAPIPRTRRTRRQRPPACPVDGDRPPPRPWSWGEAEAGARARAGGPP